MTPSQPRTVMTFPSADAAFRRVVEHIDAELGSPPKDELASRLRPLFPRVAIIDRDLTGEPPSLYVFRDGRYRTEHADRWWEQDHVAAATISVGTGRLTHVSFEYASLMRGKADELIGRHYSDFLQPEARDAAGAMFEALAEDGEVSTEALVQRVDGTTTRIELHAFRADSELEVRYRPITD